MRDKKIDLIKWMAISTMVVDHSRFISFFKQYDSLLYTIGRFAFPAFCFVMAFNYLRMSNAKRKKTIKKYFGNLTIFSFISEVPYVLFDKISETLNVFPTLLLGFCFMFLFNLKSNVKWLGIASLSSVSIFFNDTLMYGFLGSLLPLACFIALQSQIDGCKFLVLIPLFLAVACNAQYIIDFFIIHPLWVFSGLFVSSLSIFLCFNLNKIEISFPVPVIGYWGYWFYPAHLFFFYLINKIN